MVMKYPLQLSCIVLMALSTQLNAQEASKTVTLKQALTQADQTYPGLSAREAVIAEYKIRKQEIQSLSVLGIMLLILKRGCSNKKELVHFCASSSF